MSLVTFEAKHDNLIGILTMNRPQALNAVNLEVMKDLEQVWSRHQRAAILQKQNLTIQAHLTAVRSAFWIRMETRLL